MRFWPRRRRTTIPVVRLQGAIGVGTSLRPGLSLQTLAPALAKAFSIRGPAVALIINSPGGSPAQSSLIYTRIRSLAEEHEKSVFVFVEDAAASGGYWLACAGDEVFADATSIIGSIGVVSAGFGFQDAMERFGVERRVYTTGENKVILDPFQPEKAQDVEILRTIQNDLQDTFVTLVKSRRGDKLADEPDLFTGRFWTGTTAKTLGLIDGLGEVRSVLRERFGEKVNLRAIPIGRAPFWRVRLSGGADLSADAVIGALRNDALWSRLGL